MSNGEETGRDRSKVGEIRPSQLLFNYGVGSIVAESRDLKEPEWQVLTQHNPGLNSHDFRLRPVGVPNSLKSYISQIVLV